MNPTQASVLFCRFLGLFLLVTGLIAVLPKLLFSPYSIAAVSDWLVLAHTPAGHQFLSEVLSVMVGDLFLVFGRPLGSWLVSTLHTPLPNNALQRTEAGGQPASVSNV